MDAYRPIVLEEMDGHIFVINNHEWVYNFDQRQRNEIAFNHVYIENFNHGTDGHNLRVICALMADQLDAYEDTIRQLRERIAELEK